jgi:hypothetical protein
MLLSASIRSRSNNIAMQLKLLNVWPTEERPAASGSARTAQ